MDADDFRNLQIEMAKRGKPVTVECDIVVECDGKRVGIPMEDAVDMTTEDLADFLDESLREYDALVSDGEIPSIQ